MTADAEVKDGTWLEWHGSLWRALGPFRKPDPDAAFEVVEFCDPAEWDDRSENGRESAYGYNVVRTTEVRVLEDAEAHDWWADVQAERAKARAEVLAGRPPRW